MRQPNFLTTESTEENLQATENYFLTMKNIAEHEVLICVICGRIGSLRLGVMIARAPDTDSDPDTDPDSRA